MQSLNPQPQPQQSAPQSPPKASEYPKAKSHKNRVREVLRSQQRPPASQKCPVQPEYQCHPTPVSHQTRSPQTPQQPSQKSPDLPTKPPPQTFPMLLNLEQNARDRSPRDCPNHAVVALPAEFQPNRDRTCNPPNPSPRAEFP